MGGTAAINKKIEGFPVGNSVNFIAPWNAEVIHLQFVKAKFGNRRASRVSIGVFLSSIWCFAFNVERPAVLVVSFWAATNSRFRGRPNGEIISP